MEIHQIPQKNRTNAQILSEILREIDVIKNNHLFHMDERIDGLSEELKNTRSELNTRFDKFDERLWVLMGLVTTSLLGIVISMVFS